ncbi:hypothetical protein [Paenibacillus sp. FSL H8-0537]|uniref:hypothetical protein n=1 Tax=Paenibacillus sp. FSL H8-0537 TaxID=2921399 RepID=UPI003101220B
MKEPTYKMPTDEAVQQMSKAEKKQFYKDYYNGRYAAVGFKPTFKRQVAYRIGGKKGLFIGIGAMIIWFCISQAIIDRFSKESMIQERMLELEKSINWSQQQLSQYEIRVQNGELTKLEQKNYNELITKYNQQVEQYNS